MSIVLGGKKGKLYIKDIICVLKENKEDIKEKGRKVSKNEEIGWKERRKEERIYGEKEGRTERW